MGPALPAQSSVAILSGWQQVAPESEGPSATPAGSTGAWAAAVCPALGISVSLPWGPAVASWVLSISRALAPVTAKQGLRSS